jgi:hypothetical protein
LLGLAQKMVCVGVATTCWRDPDRHPRIREAAEYTSLCSPPNRRVRSGEVVAERALARGASRRSCVRVRAVRR